MTSFLMSSPPISISHRLSRCRIKFQRRASSPSFSRPAARALRRACSRATWLVCELGNVLLFNRFWKSYQAFRETRNKTSRTYTFLSQLNVITYHFCVNRFVIICNGQFWKCMLTSTRNSKSNFTVSGYLIEWNTSHILFIALAYYLSDIRNM